MSVRAIVKWLERGAQRQACFAGSIAVIEPVVSYKVGRIKGLGLSQISIVLSDEDRTIATYRVRGS